MAYRPHPDQAFGTQYFYSDGCVCRECIDHRATLTAENVVKICDKAHAINADGDHIQSGFCLGCAELYVALQAVLNKQEGPPA